MQPQHLSSHKGNGWKKFITLVRAVAMGFLVSTLGIAVWSFLLLKILPPWSVLPMIFFLWAYWRFFNGSWGWKNTAASRFIYFRRGKLNAQTWKWGLTGAASFVLLVQASFVVTFRILVFPESAFTGEYKMLENMPWLTAWIMLIMSSVVAGICEETGYRGYLQVQLERNWGPASAIAVTSLIFTLIHLSKSWAHPIVPHIFFASVLLGILAYRTGSLIPGIIGHSILDILDYSIWWTHLTGGFKQRTIFETGIDLHFILWTLFLLLGLGMFFRSMAALKKKNRVMEITNHTP
jgi:membrane protease YdiL (CAAX protease family)